MDFPARVKPYLDYHGIGAEYYADHGGAYTDKGYVIRKGVIEPYLNSEHSAIFRVHLHSMHTRQFGIEPCILGLPATPERMQKIKCSLGIEDFEEASIITVGCMYPFLEQLLPLDDADVYLLNDLADCISSMEESDGELLKFCAALEALYHEVCSCHRRRHC